MKLSKGLRADRLAKEQDNPREVAFWKQWELENSYYRTKGGLLGALMSKETDATWRREWMELGPPTKRDEIVVATVVQWLGSNVGMDFMRQALKRCGYELMAQADKGER